MVLFTLSCVGLLLFLWLSFGGTMPFNPQGYRFEVAFQNAFDLADQADVRIAGVSVGKVVSKQLDTKASGTLATIQLNNQYAPIHRNATAILREKTLLGETYVQLTPGSSNSPALADGGTLPTSQVVPAVQLDEIFNTFDPQTRAAFRSWQQELATAIKGNDQNLNNVLGNLPTFRGQPHAARCRCSTSSTPRSCHWCRTAGPTFDALNRDPAALREPDHGGRDHVPHDRRQQQRARRTLPRLPDVPERAEADDGVAADVLAERRPGRQGADPGGPAARPDAQGGQPALAVPAQAVRPARAAGDGVEQGPAGHRGGAQGSEPERRARRARTVPRAAQPDPRCGCPVTSS